MMKRVKIIVISLLIISLLPSAVFADETENVTDTSAVSTGQENTVSSSDTAAAADDITKADGLYKVNGKWRYYEDGVFTKATGLVKKISNGKWYYVYKGRIKKVTGLVRRVSDGRRFYVENGVLKKVTGMVKSVDNGKWYYVTNGKFKKVTGLVSRVSDGKHYFVENGKLAKVTGMVKSLENGKWYFVSNGKFRKETGLVKRYGTGKWYYVYKGKLKRITGVVPRLSDGKTFYVTNGKLDRSFSGTFVDSDNTKYKVKNGVAKKAAVVSPLATTRHFSVNYRERGDFTVKYVIIHHMAGRLTGEQCALYFVDNQAGTSANYCIGYDGDISCSVPEGYGGVTSGNPDADKQAITIEVSDVSNSSWKIPKKAQNALVTLLADIAERYPSFNGQIIYDTGDEERINAIKAGEADWDSTVGNVFLHKWVSYAQRSCPEWHMIKILPSLCEKANALLAEKAD